MPNQPATAAGPTRSPAEAVALGKRLADEGHAAGWPATTGQCDARLSLILPGADEPLSGYGWETSNSDRHAR